MSLFERVLTSMKEMLLLRYRFDQLSAEVARLTAGQEALRDRVLRLEFVIDEARRRSEQRRLPPAD